MSRIYSPRFSTLGTSAEANDRRFDFWVICIIHLMALLALYASTVSPKALTSTALYLGFSLGFAGLTAGIAANLPRRLGLPVLPICESLRAGSLDICIAVRRITTSLAAGILLAYLIPLYDYMLYKWLGVGEHTSRAIVPNAIGLMSAIVSEEIIFRACIFAVFASIIDLIWRHRSLSRKLVPLCMANVLQALLFGVGHIAVGRSVLDGTAWYIQLPLIWQTWGGIAFGLIYWRYGIEASILCHATADFGLLALWSSR